MTAQAQLQPSPADRVSPPRQAAFWMYLGLFAIMFWVMVDDYRTFRTTPAEVLLAVLLWAVFLAAALWVIDRLDQFDAEPWSLRAAAFGWGFVVAASVALLGNLATISVLGKLAPSLVAPHPLAPAGPAVALDAPTIEETSKLLGVITIALIARARFCRLTVGMIFGLLVGLGFQVQEDIGYALKDARDAGGTDVVLDTFVNRALLSGWHSHAVYTAIAGLGVAYYLVRTDRSQARRLLVAVALYGLAWLVHFLFDGPANALGAAGQLVTGVLTAVAFYLLYRWARRSDHQRLATVVARGASNVAVSHAEAEALASPHSRRRARRAARKRHGQKAGQLVGDLQHTQLGYASAIMHEDPAAAATQRRRIDAIRADLTPTTS